MNAAVLGLKGVPTWQLGMNMLPSPMVLERAVPIDASAEELGRNEDGFRRIYKEREPPSDTRALDITMKDMARSIPSLFMDHSQNPPAPVANAKDIELQPEPPGLKGLKMAFQGGG